jgi:hypothetical protein
MNHSPLVSHAPTSSANISPPAIGSAMPGRLCERTIVTLVANAP